MSIALKPSKKFKKIIFVVMLGALTIVFSINYFRLGASKESASTVREFSEWGLLRDFSDALSVDAGEVASKDKVHYNLPVSDWIPAVRNLNPITVRVDPAGVTYWFESDRFSYCTLRYYRHGKFFLFDCENRTEKFE